jgi:tetratricopeptide (TPR) repeat protein
MLIGVSGGRAISIADSVNAIVRGAVEANRVLRRRTLIDKVRIDQIEFVEIYEDAAIEAVHAAAALKDSLRTALEPGERVEFDCRLRSLPSGLARRAQSQYATGWWRRISVTGKKPSDGIGTLRFENLTDRARSEQTRTASQVALIDSLLENVTRQSTYDEGSAVTLFELLLPNALKDRAPDAADLVLVLDRTAARYPWELMAERTRDSIAPLAVRMGMLRQLKTREFRALPRGVRDHQAFVVGDPLLSDDPNPMWPALPGARDEAREVAEVLERNGFTPTSVIREGSASIIRQLFAHDYRILHLAGHGDYNEQHPSRSGMVLRKDPKDPANDVYLTTMELRQIRVVPDLVFINCCHLGNIDRPLSFPAHRLAASIAEELIGMGVKAVVAAGWAVDDTAATVFASSFYRSMLSGRKFGESVKLARQDAFNLGRNNTWGAYQCYGNPDFALTPPADHEGAATRTFCVQRECLDELNDIAASTEGATSDELDLLKARTDAVDRALKSYWRDGESLFRLAEARKAMNDFEGAIPLYREAIHREKSSAPITAIEQLANVLDRSAATIWDSDPKRAAEQWQEAAGRLENLGLLLDDAVQKNTERLALLGALYKRRRSADPAIEQEYLKKSAEHYSEAYEYARDRLGKQDVYVGLNAITAAWLGGQPLPEFTADCIKAAASGKGADNFWDRVGCADALLLEYLTQSNLPGHEDAVIQAYRDAFQHARPNQRDSALKQVQLLRDRGDAAARPSLDIILAAL